MAQSKNPLKRHRLPREIIRMAVRWYCRYSLSCRDVRDMLAERGVIVDASTIHRWVRKFGPRSASGLMALTVLDAGCNGMSMKPVSALEGGGVTFGEPSICAAN